MSAGERSGGRLRRAVPLLLTIAGFATIGALFVRRLLLPGEAAGRAALGAAGLLYAGWLVWESRVSARELAKPAEDNDRGTMELAAAAKIATLVAALAGGGEAGAWLGATAIVVMIGGIALRAGAIRRLGAGYSHRIRLPSVALAGDGPYAVVRHPAYLGTLLAHTGLVLAVPSAPALAALLGLWYPAVLVRTVVEDRWLRRAVPEYEAYAARVRWRLVPGVY